MLHTSCEITEKRIETNLCHGGVQTRLKAPIINVLKHTQRIMSAIFSTKSSKIIDKLYLTNQITITGMHVSLQMAIKTYQF